VYAQYTVRLTERDDVAARLKDVGIPIGAHYPNCLHEQPAFAPVGYKIGNFSVSEAASREMLSLPMHPCLSREDQERVIDALRTAVKTVA